MLRVRFRFRLTGHALQVERFEADDVVLSDEARRGLMLPVVDDVVGFRVQAADLLPRAPVRAARVLPVFAGCPAREGDTACLCFLTAANLVVDMAELGFGQVDELAVGHGERVHHPAVDADHRTGLLAFDWQGLVDEHDGFLRPVHADARVCTYRLTGPDADVDAVPAGLPRKVDGLGVLPCDDNLPVVFVQLSPVRVCAFAVPAHEIHVVMAGLEPWHHAGVPVLLA